MNYFAPPFKHGVANKTAVLLVNLGTPDAPTARAVRRYLAEFLSDPRVVEIPRLVWRPLLHGIILRVRPKKSAAKYAKIWAQDGSPLRSITEKQTKLLRGYLGERGLAIETAYAMRYGEPSIERALRALAEQGVGRVLVVPLYPQYSATTTASTYDAVMRTVSKLRNVPELRFVKHFHDDPAYIEAVAARILRHWEQEGRGEKLVLSFHGIPKRNLDKGDPYHCECLKTARLLRQRLGLTEENCIVTFQSRFGRAQWLQPYTEPTLKALAKSGVKKVDVACPGFVSDCLETLEEIAMEVKTAFLTAGGTSLAYIPCVNDDPKWISALAELVERNASGWPIERLGPEAQQIQQTQLEQSRQRAYATGATA